MTVSIVIRPSRLSRLANVQTAPRPAVMFTTTGSPRGRRLPLHLTPASSHVPWRVAGRRSLIL